MGRVERRMKRTLPALQVRSGKEAGSWNPGKDQFAASGGRLYTTCLNIYCLEVYTGTWPCTISTRKRQSKELSNKEVYVRRDSKIRKQSKDSSGNKLPISRNALASGLQQTRANASADL